MDIQKEREAFEAWYCRNHTGLKQSNLAKFRTLSGYSFSDSLKINVSWEAWQAAKAHEAEKLKGCVLVPVQCPDPDFADSLFDELSKKAIGEFGDDLLIHFSDIDEEKIWALMVEAAKAQAVPEGFVLVSKTPSLKVLDRLYAEHDIDEERAAYIYRDIINAQEPAND